MTNRITGDGYTGSVFFYKNIKSEFYGACVAEAHENLKHCCEYVFLGSCEVDVKFETDTREAEISALEKQRDNVRAELGRQVATIEDRISKLRALPHVEGMAQ